MITYILNEHKVVPEPDYAKWAEWMENSNRILAQTEIGETFISTVFLGMDMGGLFGNTHLLVFETMIFGGNADKSQWRCSTWEEAMLNHECAIEMVSNSIKGEKWSL